MAMDPRGYHNCHPLPVVRLTGLPFRCTYGDIIHFFHGLQTLDILLTGRHTRFSGDAFVLFQSLEHAELARQRNRYIMGTQHVGVIVCDRRHYYDAVAHCTLDPRPYTHILRLWGVSYGVHKVEIAGFFREFNVGEDKIGIVRGPDGRATGVAFVEFGSEEEARRALLLKDGMKIGSIYVELFPSTPDEAAAARIFQD